MKLTPRQIVLWVEDERWSWRSSEEVTRRVRVAENGPLLLCSDEPQRSS